MVQYDSSASNNDPANVPVDNFGTHLVQRFNTLLEALETETLSTETRILIEDLQSLLQQSDQAGRGEQPYSWLEIVARQIDLETYLRSFYNVYLDDFAPEDLHEVVTSVSWDIMYDQKTD